MGGMLLVGLPDGSAVRDSRLLIEGFELGPFGACEVGDTVAPSLSASVGLYDADGDADGTSLGQDRRVRPTENSKSRNLLDPASKIVPIPDTMTFSEGFKKKRSGTLVSITRILEPEFPSIVVSLSIDLSIVIMM